MSTHRSTWKRRERDTARLFGAERQVLSGSGGRGDRSRSDTTHDRLFIETNLRATSAVRSLGERTRDRARAERKTPVLALFDKRKHGALIVVHQVDLAAFVSSLTPADLAGFAERLNRDDPEEGVMA
jgi:hypothetical protein